MDEPDEEMVVALPESVIREIASWAPTSPEARVLVAGCLLALTGHQGTLASLSTLPDDWDGYGAATISDAALAVVRALHVVPTVNGGVQIEWHANGWDVEVEVSKDGIPTGVLMEAT